METKKKAPKNPEASASGQSEDSKKPELLLKPATRGLWPDWLPYGHGVFLLLLLLTLLLGYGLPYQKPEQPLRDYRSNSKSAEEEVKATQEYESKKEAYDKEKKACDSAPLTTVASILEKSGTR